MGTQQFFPWHCTCGFAQPPPLDALFRKFLPLFELVEIAESAGLLVPLKVRCVGTGDWAACCCVVAASVACRLEEPSPKTGGGVPLQVQPQAQVTSAQSTDTSSWPECTMEQRFVDTSPRRLFSSSWRSRSPGKFSSSLGICPVSWLWPSSSSRRPLSSPRDAGIWKPSPLFCKLNHLSPRRFPSSAGMGPTRLLEYNQSPSNVNRRPSSAGMRPVSSATKERTRELRHKNRNQILEAP